MFFCFQIFAIMNSNIMCIFMSSSTCMQKWNIFSNVQLYKTKSNCFPKWLYHLSLYQQCIKDPCALQIVSIRSLEFYWWVIENSISCSLLTFLQLLVKLDDCSYVYWLYTSFIACILIMSIFIVNFLFHFNLWDFFMYTWL